MKKINISKRLVALLQTWISVGLIVLSFALSLTPLFSIDTTKVGYGENGGSLKAAVAATVTEVTGVELSPSDIDDYIGISPIKLISSIDLFIRIVGANSNNSVEEADDLRERMSTESGRRDIITISALSVSFERISSGTDGNETFFAVIFNLLVAFLGFIAVLILTVAIPIIFFIKAVIAVTLALIDLKSPERVSGRLGGSLTSIITLPIVYMLVQCVVPGLGVAVGTVLLVVISTLSALINLAATRLREYPDEQLVFLNATQGCALLSLAGFIVYFFSLLNTGILNAFIEGSFTEYIGRVFSISANDPSAEINGKYMVSGILMLIYAVLAVSSATHFDKSVRRLCLAGAKKEHNVFQALISLAVCIAPLAVSGAKHYYLDPTSTASVGDASFLPAESFNGGALTGAVIGASIMLIAEIAAILLSKTLAGDISSADKKYLLSGRSMLDYMVGTSEQRSATESSVSTTSETASVVGTESEDE